MRQLHGLPRAGERGQHAVQPRRRARVGQAAAAGRHRLQDGDLNMSKPAKAFQKKLQLHLLGKESYKQWVIKIADFMRT